MTAPAPDALTTAYARAGFVLLVAYAVLTTTAIGLLLYYETVVRQSPPVIECAAPSSHTPK
jgi:hypothetical protein